jgi:3-demethylubiquinone-9 3-methyltransferase
LAALNDGPDFRFTEAVSFQVSCGSQEEVDEYWSKLAAGGEQGQCGWLKDRYGPSWQIVPTALHELLADPDPGPSQRAMQAMEKIDIAELRRAGDQAQAWPATAADARQRLASWNRATSSAGTRPRWLTSMPWDSAQARTALGS